MNKFYTFLKWPGQKNRNTDTARNKTENSYCLLWIFVFCILIAVLIFPGIVYYKYEAARLQDEKYGDIAAIAGLKSDSLIEWRINSLADVHRVSIEPLIRREISKLLENPASQNSIAMLKVQLNINRNGSIYADALFLDKQGNILLSDMFDSTPINQATRDAIEIAAKEHKEVISDFYRVPTGPIYIDAVAPVYDFSGRLISFIILRSNATDFIYPLIQRWPTSSKTAETLLVERDGDSVLYMNELRHRKNTALTFRMPVSSIDLPAAQAVLGKYGRFYGKDYRGVDVLAVLLSVPDTGWSMIAKVDENEILSEVRYRAWVVIIVVSLSILIMGGTVNIFYRNRNQAERIQAEEALRESEEIFSQFMKHSPVYVFFKDDKIRSIRLSDNYEKMLGKPLNELLGKNMDELFPSDLAKKMVENDMRLLREGKEFVLDEEFNGHYYTTIKFPIFIENKPRMLAGYTIDITDRRRAEEEKRRLEERLARAEKMEALGTLAGGVAHDLNNVLGIIVGFAELLLDMEDDGNESDRMEYLKNIHDGGRKAAAMVEDLLTMARRGVQGREALNLNNIIKSYEGSPEFSNLSQFHSSVKVITDLDPDILNISGSHIHLEKMLYNLILNAFEAMPNGGVLTIATANHYLERPIKGYDEVRTGEYVVLSISDTGVGINAADIKRIFEPFYTKKIMGRSGTGLGLAVVWGTVKDHNGYINVDSEEGKGSVFMLYFPVTRENMTSIQASVSIAEYMGKGESILIVDDVKGQRDLAAAMLRNLNYNVSGVSSGEEALEYLKGHPVDLIILDMIMDPGMDGLDTYKSVLEINPRQKAVIVSGFSETARVEEAQAAGAGAYVKKPYIMEKLGMAVRNELDRRT